MEEILVGGHVSSSGGILRAFDNADEIGANFVQIFTQSPRTWRASSIKDGDAELFRAKIADPACNTAGVVTHASYLINLASQDNEIFEKSKVALLHSVEIATSIGASGTVLHVGSHKGAGFDTVLGQMVSALDLALNSIEGPCPILLENTAGQGGSIGVSFEEIARIIDALGGREDIGVCLDTQHLFAAGYSFSSIDEADSLMDQFSRIIGFERLGCIHLNDSKVQLGSQRDRHENIGQGQIGYGPLSLFASHQKVIGVPLILEVPGEGNGPRRADVDLARQMVKDGISARNTN